MSFQDLKSVFKVFKKITLKNGFSFDEEEVIKVFNTQAYAVIAYTRDLLEQSVEELGLSNWNFFYDTHMPQQLREYLAVEGVPSEYHDLFIDIGMNSLHDDEQSNEDS